MFPESANLGSLKYPSYLVWPNKSIPLRTMQNTSKNLAYYRYNNKNLWHNSTTLIAPYSSRNDASRAVAPYKEKDQYMIYETNSDWYAQYKVHGSIHPIIYFKEAS